EQDSLCDWIVIGAGQIHMALCIELCKENAAVARRRWERCRYHSVRFSRPEDCFCADNRWSFQRRKPDGAGKSVPTDEPFAVNAREHGMGHGFVRKDPREAFALADLDVAKLRPVPRRCR